MLTIACKHSAKPNDPDKNTTSYDSIEKTNDWYGNTDDSYKRLNLVRANGKIGFLYENGEELFPCIFDSVVDVKNSDYEIIKDEYVPTRTGYFTHSYNDNRYSKVKQNGKWGTIDTDGNEKLPFIYDYISNFRTESTIVQKDSKWGYINKNGIEVIPVIYDEIKWFENGLCPAKKESLWGFVNEKGKLIIPMMYDDILVSEKISVDDGLWFFSQDGYCAVKKNGEWGLIDKDNNMVINFEYDGIKFTSSGLDDWRYFSDGFLPVQKGKFWSVVNQDGLNHIPFEYDDVEIWSDGNVCVKRNDKWGLLDSLGGQLVPIEHKCAMDAGNFYK